jgi:hypothetical protein
MQAKKATESATKMKKVTVFHNLTMEVTSHHLSTSQKQATGSNPTQRKETIQGMNIRREEHWSHLRRSHIPRCWWLMHTILATWEAEIRRIEV